MNTPLSTEHVTPQSDPRIEVFRKQLRESLTAGGCFYVNEIASNIEGLIVAHIMRLVEQGIRFKVDHDH